MSATFEVGQKVRTDDGEDGEITYGPFSSTYGTYTGYVVRTDAGERLQRAHDLVAIPEPPAFAVGDKVRTASGLVGVVDGGPFRARHTSGAVFWAVADEDGMHVTPFETALTKVVDETTYTHAGVTYDLTATYNDRDREPWTFKRFGDEVRGGCNGFDPSSFSEPLAGVVDMYGPLTRV